MDDITLLSAVLDETGTQAAAHKGFPNAAHDQITTPLSLDKLLIQNRASTYLFRIRGDDWQDSGIFDGDIAIVDRALSPTPNTLVIGWDETETFYISKPTLEHTGRVWGVVTATIHPLSRKT